MKIAPRQIASFLAKPPDKISAILLHGSDSGLRSSRSQQLANLYSDNLDDVFSVTRISGASLSGEPGKIADAAAEISMLDTRLVLVKASGAELLDACKLLLTKPVHNSMVIAKPRRNKRESVTIYRHTILLKYGLCQLPDIPIIVWIASYGGGCI